VSLYPVYLAMSYGLCVYIKVVKLIVCNCVIDPYGSIGCSTVRVVVCDCGLSLLSDWSYVYVVSSGMWNLVKLTVCALSSLANCMNCVAVSYSGQVAVIVECLIDVELLDWTTCCVHVQCS